MQIFKKRKNYQSVKIQSGNQSKTNNLANFRNQIADTYELFLTLIKILGPLCDFISILRAVGGGCAGCAAAHPVFWPLPLKMREFWS